MEDLKIGFAHTLNAFHCSVAFMLLFTTYNAVQNLSSSFYDGSLGYWSIATTYISLCLCSFFVAGPLVMKLGSKYSMILGFCFYFLFLLANKFASFYTLIPAASLTGFGSSLVWVGQGSYITACAINYSKVRNHLSPKDSIGTFIGYFFLMVQFSQVFGNLLSSFVLVDSVSSRDTLMYIFIGLCGFSVFIIFFLREEQSLVTPTETSLFQKVSHVFLLLKDKKMLLIIPSFASCGCVQSFLFGIFTAEIVKPSLGTGQIGFAMSAYGITTLFCFLIFGKFGDRFGHFYVSLIGFFVNIFLLVMYFFITNIYSTSWLGRHSFIVYASAALFGVGDSALYLFIKVMMSSLYTDNVEPAYALLQFFKALAMAITFAIGPYLSLATKINLFLCVNLFGLFCILFLELFVIPSSNNLTVDNNSETEDFSLVHRSIEGDVNVEAIEEKD